MKRGRLRSGGHVDALRQVRNTYGIIMVHFSCVVCVSFTAGHVITGFVIIVYNRE